MKQLNTTHATHFYLFFSKTGFLIEKEKRQIVDGVEVIQRIALKGGYQKPQHQKMVKLRIYKEPIY